MTGATYFANGSPIASATRGTLHTAWSTGGVVTARLVGINYQNASITDIRNSFGNSGFFILNGNAMLVAILDGDAADYADAVALAEDEAARLITVLGL